MHSTLALVNSEFNEMVREVPKLKQLDFSPLLKAQTGYADQEEIDIERVHQITASAVHYGMDFGLVVRYLGGEYTGAWRQTDKILEAAAPHVDT
ncbi:hypothetical protein ACHAWF_004031 [Thalassiosira exigua]